MATVGFVFVVVVAAIGSDLPINLKNSENLMIYNFEKSTKASTVGKRKTTSPIKYVLIITPAQNNDQNILQKFNVRIDYVKPETVFYAKSYQISLYAKN